MSSTRSRARGRSPRRRSRSPTSSRRRRWRSCGGRSTRPGEGSEAAPKFPQPMTLEFVLRMAVRGTPDALSMLTTTLDRMAAGGIYDQLGGGFARYSTDATWLVPHFEKMLYDNAQLAQLYTRAWIVTRHEHYRRVATDTLRYLLREMRHADGGFFSSQDADSEGVEGKFFTWSWDELVGLVGADAAAAFGADAGRELGERADERPVAAARVRDRRGRPRASSEDPVRGAGATRASRDGRQGPLGLERDGDPGARRGRDGLRRPRAPGGRGDGGGVRPVEPARGRTGGCSARGGTGRPAAVAYADDHALLASAMLTLFSRTGDLRWFREARRLADDLVRLFADEERGGFFQTGIDVDPLVVRPKELYDNAVPSGNSVAAEVLQRLALLTGDRDLERIGVSALRPIRDVLGRAPAGFGHALQALDLYLGPSQEVAVVGATDDPATRTLIDEVVTARFLPNVVVAVAAPEDREASGRGGPPPRPPDGGREADRLRLPAVRVPPPRHDPGGARRSARGRPRLDSRAPRPTKRDDRKGPRRAHRHDPHEQGLVHRPPAARSRAEDRRELRRPRERVQGVEGPARRADEVHARCIRARSSTG